MKLFPLLLLLCGCGYGFGHGKRSLPGGHKTVFIEMFKNQSKELGAEASFTQALNRELERSGFVIVTSKDTAEIILQGSILSVSNTGTAPTQANTFFDENNDTQGTPVALPATYFEAYNLGVMTNLKAIRSRDQKIIWQTTLRGAKSYRGASLRKQGIRSSNVLYNHSRKKQTMKLIAQDMMREAFDRLTENF